MSSSARRRLIAEARQLGYEVVGYDGRGHLRLEHSGEGAPFSLPNSVPDHRPLIARYRAQMTRAAGASHQGREAVEGARRRCRRPRPLPDPAATRAAADRAAILDQKNARDTVLRRLGQLDDVRRLMGRP